MLFLLVYSEKQLISTISIGTSAIQYTRIYVSKVSSIQPCNIIKEIAFPSLHRLIDVNKHHGDVSKTTSKRDACRSYCLSDYDQSRRQTVYGTSVRLACSLHII